MEGFSVNMGIISSLLIKYLGIHHHHRHRHCHSSFTRYFLSTPLSLSLIAISLSNSFSCSHLKQILTEQTKRIPFQVASISFAVFTSRFHFWCVFLLRIWSDFVWYMFDSIYYEASFSLFALMIWVIWVNWGFHGSPLKWSVVQNFPLQAPVLQEISLQVKGFSGKT